MAAGAGIGISATLPPVYRASTSLLVKDRDSGGDTGFADEYLTETYKELLTKRPVIEAAVQPFGLDPREVEKHIEVRLVPKTPLIMVAVEASDPRVAMELANGIVVAFLETSRDSTGIRVRDLVVVEPASLPQKPISPQRLRITLVMTILGILAASGVVFLVEYLDDTIESVEDVHHGLSLPTLAVIPRSSGRRKRGKGLNIEDNSDPRVVEAYRILRTGLQFSQQHGSARILSVVAPSSEEGKATVVTSLAVVMARAGHKVLLVDADLRQPQLHRSFGLAQEPGFSTLLMEIGDLQEYVTETDIPSLYFLPSGSIPADPLELLSSARMTWLTEELREHFDIVLFNTSPILMAAEAVVLAAQVDGTVLVIESRSTRQEGAAQALRMLRNVQADVLGGVLTGVRIKPFGYQYYSDFSRPEGSSKATLYQNHSGLEQTGGSIFSLSDPRSEPVDSLDRFST
jgi:capsular exopolysaccharide synthesis family protein